MRERRPPTYRTPYGHGTGYAGPAGAYLERDKRENEYDGLQSPPTGPRPRPCTVDRRGQRESATLLPITFGPLGYLHTTHRRLLRGEMHSQDDLRS